MFSFSFVAPYVFAFTRHVLGWEATDYSLWVTYKNLIATTGRFRPHLIIITIKFFITFVLLSYVFEKLFK